MKHKLYNRLLSLALAVGLVAGMLPGVTFAGAVDTTAPQSQAEQIAEPTEEPETVSEESSQVEATPTPAPESSQVEETPAPSQEPEDTEQEQLKTVVVTDAGPFLIPVNVKSSYVAAAAANALQQESRAQAQSDAVFTNKTVSDNNDGTYTIQLEAYTTGTVTGGEPLPADIVLVLDQSGSMGEGFDSQYSRQQAMKNAVNSFITEVADQYSADADHRISIVTFGNGATRRMDWTYVNQQGESTLHSSVNRLPTSPSGATDVASGMNEAKDLINSPENGGDYSYNGKNTERSKVVIVFTDGVPTTSNTYSKSVADQAVQYSKDIKDAGATIYSVGIFPGANPSQLYGGSGNSGAIGDNWMGRSIIGIEISDAETAAANRFLNFLSSNYSDASNDGLDVELVDIIIYSEIKFTINQNYNRINDTDQYYLSAEDTESLNDIFEEISDNISSPSIELGEDSVVTDTVTPYFDLPANSSAITLQQADYDGSSFGAPYNTPDTVQARVEGQQVIVTGFDFDKNFVTDTAKEDGTYGKKLIITFTITPDEEFWGGNKVPTNVTESSDVSDSEGTTVENFPVPDPVDVPLKEIDLQDQIYNIYYKGAVPTSDEIHSDVIDFPNDWRTEFVNLTYSPDTTEVDNAQDGTYNLAATLSPKYEGTQSAKHDNATVTVNVFTPVIKWTDSTRETGTQLTETLLNSHKVSEKWMHGNTDSANAIMFEKTPPTLTYGFTDANNVSNLVNTSLNAEKHVKVTVKIGDEDITSVVNFEWQAGDGCVGCTDPNEGTPKYQFRIHVGNGDLTIIKRISGGAGPYDNAVFDFKIEAENGMVYYVHLDASSGKAQDTITLPTGEYTVTELDNLNYTPQGNSVQEVTVGGNDATVTFTNNSTPTKIPSDSGATQNLPNWENTDDKLTWQKDEDLDGEPDTTTSN